MPRKLSERLGQHHVAEVQRRDGQQRRQHDRQDVAPDDRASALAPNVRAASTNTRLASSADSARAVRRYTGMRVIASTSNDVGGARREHVEHDDGQQQRREAHDDVGDPHRDGLAPAAVVAGPHADQRADHGGDDHRGDGDRQRGPAGDDQPGEHAAPERVGAQHVGPAVRQVNGAWLELSRSMWVARFPTSIGPKIAVRKTRPRITAATAATRSLTSSRNHFERSRRLRGAGLADDGGGGLDGYQIDLSAHVLCSVA